MSTFVRTIGKANFNNCGLDVYENNNGSATIRPTYCYRDKPKKFWRTFGSLEALEAWIVDNNPDDLSSVSLVAHLIKKSDFMSHEEFMLACEKERLNSH